MRRSLRDATRVALNAYPVSRFRSFEERLGILVFAAMALFVMCQSVPAHGFKAASLDIAHPWSRAVPASAKVAAGYLVVSNTGSEPDRLVSVTGEIAGRTEIHEMAVDAAGVMTMRPLPQGIEIPAGGKVELKPGSLHIMFLDLRDRPTVGTKFKGTLTFEKAGTVDVEFAVEAHAGGESAHGGHGG